MAKTRKNAPEKAFIIIYYRKPQKRPQTKKLRLWTIGDAQSRGIKLNFFDGEFF